MPFHVEVSTALRHARVFNLSAEELRQTVLEPWLSRRSIELGDRKWNPEECELKVLEGPELGNTDLNFGQGWSNAQRSAADVTARVLDAAQASHAAGAGPTAMVIETDSAVQTVAELASDHGARTVDLAGLSERIDGRDPEVAAVIVVVQRQR
jgi:hypothetical protein